MLMLMKHPVKMTKEADNYLNFNEMVIIGSEDDMYLVVANGSLMHVHVNDMTKSAPYYVAEVM